MLCEECRQNPATVVITVLTGQETTTRHLCQDCVEKIENSSAQGDVSSFLSSLLSILSRQPKEETLRCSACGLTYEDFQTSGKLGCAQCYQDFSKQLAPLLQRVHGRTQHAGRVPKSHSKERELADSITALKARMDEAVGLEDFEQAAAIRDEIRALVEKQSAEVHPQ